MGGSEVRASEKRSKRNRNGGQSHLNGSSNISSDADSVSTASQSSKKGSRKRKHREESSRSRTTVNGTKVNVSAALSTRRPSLTQPARDPRDFTTKPTKRPRVDADAGADAHGHADADADADTDANNGKLTRSLSPYIDFDGLSRPSRGTRERLEETDEQKAERQKKIEGAVRTILECVGEDVERPGILDTPRRYAEAMLFFTEGYQQNVRDVVNGAIFEEGHSEMVIVKGIDIFSLCEHHLVPFTGKMHIAYIPKNQVIGISKLPRIAEMFSRRFQIQERLTKEVANAIMEILKPQGVAVVMESSHLCMVMRGVQKTTATTITSCVLGCFERKSKTRNEFLSLVGLKN
ncbi:GTP cyclohydrolase I [Sodiomyces alkalinus F11]|uniref:GTP cyclohydrolase 1 n=1 Tax=Sodiomyces alkalinus (strain CBS 110278 / VKM F-3762 / F11) TaxID=1314773 RepID=A0A3N2PJ55_SODAK|nr:GTP cyclohydrolase I [Sodiomyces alkalinus F11]ROT34572.1 GTP cyclohydrolase I [Sodiomyces alkalinus F11]